jgi:hypothetical protein
MEDKKYPLIVKVVFFIVVGLIIRIIIPLIIQVIQLIWLGVRWLVRKILHGNKEKYEMKFMDENGVEQTKFVWI